MANTVFIILILIYLDNYYSYANCTGSCIENFRRKWPKLDFEFYYDHQNISISRTDNVSYSVHTETNEFLQTTTPSLPSMISIFPPSFQVFMNNTNAANSPTTIFPINCSNEKDLINASSNAMNLLLKTSFHVKKPHNFTGENLSEHFRNRLTQIYQYGLNQQSELSHSIPNDSLELKILSVIFDDSKETIHVIYSLEENGTVVSFEQADQILSSTSLDLMQNLTGYPIISKVEPYIVKAPSESSFMNQSNWLSLASMLMALAALLLIFLLFVLCFYCLFKREREHWLESINREINRVIPSEPDDICNSNLNSATSSADDLSFAGNIKKLDKSSQYDYGSLNVKQQPTWSTFATTTSTKLPYSSSQNKERLIPVQNISNDYDRISYVHSKETIQETHKHPNILEIKLREETQSIVKEIRKELDRYNQRKFLNDDSSTSEA